MQCVSLSADGSRLAIAHPRGQATATLLELAGDKLKNWTPFGRPSAEWHFAFAALSQDGKTLAYPDLDAKTVLVRDLVTGEEKSIEVQEMCCRLHSARPKDLGHRLYG